ncbi:lysine N(6)-hydroxylase/L-ornithine N(5)-oxygenase family protein [Chromobacterium aquaticum]|uniref:Lysine N(6)-hydroxylase/L-ornithine N(5)-oxygenase family protein n=1 Tax=Chromobacterium aquaticum TaxID=467180 RepID=A0ABV8ZW16_9NEIS|nr:SidA/IucD/PvdA family monooxygenase [Chromobacterium aquaticum]MCD5364514.1 SidA/IucD/PvdA family monooxygenase [Chromobacterium aquaticum]
MKYHCIGIGSGPSNLSVASLLHGQHDIKSIFFEQKPAFSWHDGMMIPGAGLQVSLFKDLVTLADPTNRFSFVSYLHQHGRLLQFLNARFDQVSRLEFRDYLKWAAENNANICFGERVLEVDFDGGAFVVQTTKRRVLGDNVVVGVGIVPDVPDFARACLNDSTHFHVNEFAAKAGVAAGKRVLVIGGGQSGAEVVLEMLRRGGGQAPAALSWLSRRENYFPLDDSPFTNDLYTPTHSNYFYEQDEGFRRAFIKRNLLSSDGISECTLRSIYQQIYSLRFIERAPIEISLLPFREVRAITQDGERWSIAASHLGANKPETLEADVVIWASGFKPAPTPFLQPLRERLELEGEEIAVDRDYAALGKLPRNRSLFILNGIRQQRGLADPNLSLTAWRSQIVIQRMLDVPRVAHLDAAFVSWAPLAAARATSRQPRREWA